MVDVLMTFSIETDLDSLVHCALLNGWALLIIYSYFHTYSRLRIPSIRVEDVSGFPRVGT